MALKGPARQLSGTLRTDHEASNLFPTWAYIGIYTVADHFSIALS